MSLAINELPVVRPSRQLTTFLAYSRCNALLSCGRKRSVTSRGLGSLYKSVSGIQVGSPRVDTWPFDSIEGLMGTAIRENAWLKVTIGYRDVVHAFTGLFAADSRFGRNGHATVTTSSGRLCSFRDAVVVQENVEDAAGFNQGNSKDKWISSFSDLYFSNCKNVWVSQTFDKDISKQDIRWNSVVNNGRWRRWRWCMIESNSQYIKKQLNINVKKYILLAIKEIYTFVFFTRLYIYFFNNVSFALSCQISPHEWRIYACERDNASNQYARSKDVKHAETRQKNRVVIQPLIKFELCLGCSRGFTRVALRVYDTSQLRPETVTRRATNFILRYVDWRLEEARPQWRERARELDLLHRVLYAFP